MADEIKAICKKCGNRWKQSDYENKNDFPLECPICFPKTKILLGIKEKELLIDILDSTRVINMLDEEEEIKNLTSIKIKLKNG